MRISDWSSDVCSSDLGDALFLGASGDRFTHFLRRRDVAGAFEAFGKCFFDGRGADHRYRRIRRDDLRIDVLRRAVNRQAMYTELTDVGARTAGAANAGLLLVLHDSNFLVTTKMFARSNQVHMRSAARRRSEEHTSELKSLMPTTNAVLC